MESARLSRLVLHRAADGSMEVRGHEPPLDLELRAMLTQARETLRELDETHRRWAAQHEKAAALVARTRAAERLRAAAGRAWASVAARVRVTAGERVEVTLDPEAAGIRRAVAPEVLRLLAEAAEADIEWWRRTQATGIDFRLTLGEPPPPPPVEAPVALAPIGPARMGSPRPS